MKSRTTLVNEGELESAPVPPAPWKVRWASNLVRAPIFFIATALFGSASLLCSIFDREGKLQHRIARAWAKAVLRISGSPVTVIGAENLIVASAAVYACNHLSYMDTPVIFASLPFQFRILARSNLWKLPFIGWHLDRSGQIPVNAENPRASVASLSRGVKALRAGMPLFVFPEGGRTRDGSLGPFMSGPAYMAVRARAPLVPMALIGTYEVLPIHTHHFRPGPVRLLVGRPIPTEGFTTQNIAMLTERLRAAIADLAHGNGSLDRSSVCATEKGEKA